MLVPPNMKRRVQPFSFTELSLSDAEMDAMCVIPSKALSRVEAPAAVAVATPRKRRSHRAMAIAGAAFLALPACSLIPADEAMDFAADAAELASAALSITKTTFIAAKPEAVVAVTVQAAAPAPAAEPAAMPVPALVDRALLVRAGEAMDHGQYRAALAMYQKLLRREPRQVDALFGAALASYELKESKASAKYLTRTLKLQPNHPLANVLAGFGEQLGKRYGGARDHYGRFLSVAEEGDQAEEIRAVLARLPDAQGSAVAGQR